MNRRATTTSLVLLMLAFCAPTLAANTPAAKRTAWLSTNGNQIVRPDGSLWQGRGANIQDTRSCWACADTPNVEESKRRIKSLIHDWGANFIRLTMESYDNHGNILADANYMRDVVELVRYVGTFDNVYVLVSLWHDPTLGAKDGFPSPAGHAIWQALVETFYDSPHVMFGISNEPTENDGSRDAELYARMNETVAAIRAVEAKHGARQHLVAVQGTQDWARRLHYYIKHPIAAGAGKNVIYETHIYNVAKDFAQLIEVPAKTLPMIIGEFGPRPQIDMQMDDCVKLVELAEKLHISWLAWNFHYNCNPNLLQSTNHDRCGVGMPLVPSVPWGEFIHKRLQRASQRPPPPKAHP